VKLLPSMAKEEMRSLYFGLFMGSIIPLTLIYIGYASKVVGIILLIIFVLYTYQLSRVRTVEEAPSGEEKRNLRKYALLTLTGIIVVIIVSYFIVDTASYIAVSFGIQPVVIGGTIVFSGTSIPILMAGVYSVRKGLSDLALGNIVGSSFIDTTLILGAILVISPLNVDIVAFSSLVVFSVISNLFLWYFLSSEKIGWREGVVLLSIYLLFLTINFSSYGV